MMTPLQQAGALAEEISLSILGIMAEYETAIARAEENGDDEIDFDGITFQRLAAIGIKASRISGIIEGAPDAQKEPAISDGLPSL